MEIEIKKIRVSKLKRNDGDIAGVPSNPRYWSSDDLDRLAKSMEETPELTEMRGCIVYPLEKQYVVLGGNMRCAAAKKLGWEELTCAIVPKDTPADKLREIVIKDNGVWGNWDFDSLANEWPETKLEGWGVQAFEQMRINQDAVEITGEDGCASDYEGGEDNGSRERILITYPSDMQDKMDEFLRGAKLDRNNAVRIEDIEI